MVEAAGAGTTGGGGSALIVLLPLLLIGYMFISQRRRQRATQTAQQSIEVGQQVRTTSGLFGTVAALDDSVATLEVSPGVRLRFDRRAISGPAGVGSTVGTPTDMGTGTGTDTHTDEPGDTAAPDTSTSFGGASAVPPPTGR